MVQLQLIDKWIPRYSSWKMVDIQIKIFILFEAQIA